MWLPSTLVVTSFALTFTLVRDALFLFRYRNEKNTEMHPVIAASFDPRQSAADDVLGDEPAAATNRCCNPLGSVWSFLFEGRERKSPDICGTRVVGRRMLLVLGLVAFGYVLVDTYIKQASTTPQGRFDASLQTFGCVMFLSLGSTFRGQLESTILLLRFSRSTMMLPGCS